MRTKPRRVKAEGIETALTYLVLIFVQKFGLIFLKTWNVTLKGRFLEYPASLVMSHLIHLECNMKTSCFLTNVPVIAFRFISLSLLCSIVFVDLRFCLLFLDFSPQTPCTYAYFHALFSWCCLVDLFRLTWILCSLLLYIYNPWNVFNLGLIYYNSKAKFVKTSMSSHFTSVYCTETITISVLPCVLNVPRMIGEARPAPNYQGEKWSRDRPRIWSRKSISDLLAPVLVWSQQKFRTTWNCWEWGISPPRRAGAKMKQWIKCILFYFFIHFPTRGMTNQDVWNICRFLPTKLRGAKLLGNTTNQTWRMHIDDDWCFDMFQKFLLQVKRHLLRTTALKRRWGTLVCILKFEMATIVYVHVLVHWKA